MIQNLLFTCSNVLSALGLQIFNYEEEQCLRFADDLVSGNVIEAMRLAITDELNLFGVHEDQKKDSNFPSVPVFSHSIVLLKKKYRVSIIMYSRWSILIT